MRMIAHALVAVEELLTEAGRLLRVWSSWTPLVSAEKCVEASDWPQGSCPDGPHITANRHGSTYVQPYTAVEEA